MRFVAAVIIALSLFALYGDEDSPETQAKRQECVQACTTFDECGFELKGLSTPACIDQCMTQSNMEWSDCVLKHKHEYGCCAQALDYCSQHLE